MAVGNDALAGDARVGDGAYAGENSQLLTVDSSASRRIVFVLLRRR